jgi:hypothetical protein
MPRSGVYESRADVRGCVVVVRNATPGGADINVPRRLMVKFFRRGVESGATEPSSYRNLGA